MVVRCRIVKYRMVRSNIVSSRMDKCSIFYMKDSPG